MVNALISFLEDSWLFLILISILFIFFIIVRDLGNQTRKTKTWRRSSYNKLLPRVTLTYQHFSRRGELLSITAYGMCQNIRHDMLHYLQVRKGFTDDELENLVKNREELEALFQDSNIALFLYDSSLWIQSVTPALSFFEKLVLPIKRFFKDEKDLNSKFYIDLAVVIKDFRKALDS